MTQELKADLEKANKRLAELEGVMRNSSFQLTLSRTELWVGRIFAIILVVSFVMLAYSFYLTAESIKTTNQNVEVVKNGLANATPSDVLLAVNELKETTLTKEEVKAIVINESVWAAERDEWYKWKLEVDRKITTIIQLQETAAKNLAKAAEDRFYGRDFRLWLQELKQANAGKDIIIPDFSVHD